MKMKSKFSKLCPESPSGRPCDCLYIAIVLSVTLRD